jgi:NTP pyrophosphatase (non-canonical NTP hydrolase)
MGELARAILNNDRENLQEEMADTLAWLFSLANVCDIDLEDAFLKKYPLSCVKCNENPCCCIMRKKGIPEEGEEEGEGDE